MEKKLYPFKFIPVASPRPWGGDALVKELGKHFVECDDEGNETVLGADVKIDGTVGMYSGIFNNPFIIWGRYRRKFFKYNLPVSFQFHHTQMDGEQAGKFLENLKSAIIRCYK